MAPNSPGLLCQITSGNNAGLITYGDGRVVQIDPKGPSSPTSLTMVMPDGNKMEMSNLKPGQVKRIQDSQNHKILLEANHTKSFTIPNLAADQIQLIRILQGGEFGDCGAQMGGVRFAILPNLYKGQPLKGITKEDGTILTAWGVSDLSTLQENFGDKTNRAFFCSDKNNQGTIGVNMSEGYQAIAQSGIAILLDNCGSLDSAHCDVAKDSLNMQYSTMFHVAPLPTFSEKYIVPPALGLLSLAGVTLVFGLAVPWLTKWKGPKDGGGHGGGGGTQATADPAQALAAAAQLIAALASAGGLAPAAAPDAAQPDNQAADSNASAKAPLPPVAVGILALHGNGPLPANASAGAPGDAGAVAAQGATMVLIPVVPVTPVVAPVAAPVFAP